MIYDDLTILMKLPIALKSVTRAPKIGTSSPISDIMMIYDDLTIPDTLLMYDHSNHLLTHHSNQLLTHSLKIPAKIESPQARFARFGD